MTLVQDKESKVLRKSLQITLGIVAAAYPCLMLGQAPAAQLFVVCGSQQNQPTVYVSGVLQGTNAALPGFQSGFSAFLVQRYAYKGIVACLPTNSAVNAQNFINTRSTALRNAKKTVVNTGWNPGASAMPAAVPPAVSTAAAPSTARSTVRSTSTAPSAAPSTSGAAPSTSGATPSTSGATPSTSGAAGGVSQLTSALGNIFGGGSAGTGAAGGTSSAGCGATPATTANASTAAPAGKAGASGNAGSGCQSALVQVSNALASVFKSANGATSSPGAPKNAPASVPDGGLGSGQAQNTKLTVYGCGRQDLQVACVSDLANQSKKDTLVQAADVWKDAFIVDDRGDRHLRSGGFFLNIDGDQRPQLDIAYGKTARFILMFDGVQTKVQKVALRATSGLDVEGIAVIDPNAAVQSSQQH
jgi:hypothetical protein